MRMMLVSVVALGAMAAMAAAQGAPKAEPAKAAEPVKRVSKGRVTAAIGKQVQPTRKVVYKTVENGKTPLDLHIFEPAGWKPGDKRPVLVTFHGGGWSAGEPSTQYYMADRLAKAGWVGISVKYRLADTRRYPHRSVFDCVKDARSAVRYVRSHAHELGVDPNRLVTNGGSAGGHLALACALFDKVNEEGEGLSVSAVPNAIIPMYPVIDTAPPPAGYGYDKLGDRYKELSPVEHVRPGLPPVLLMHGDRDGTTPTVGAKLFHERMVAAGNDITFILGKGGHGYFTYQEAPLAEAMKQVDAWLKSKGYPVPE